MVQQSHDTMTNSGVPHAPEWVDEDAVGTLIRAVYDLDQDVIADGFSKQQDELRTRRDELFQNLMSHYPLEAFHFVVGRALDAAPNVEPITYSYGDGSLVSAYQFGVKNEPHIDLWLYRHQLRDGSTRDYLWQKSLNLNGGDDRLSLISFGDDGARIALYNHSSGTYTSCEEDAGGEEAKRFFDQVIQYPITIDNTLAVSQAEGLRTYEGMNFTLNRHTSWWHEEDVTKKFSSYIASAVEVSQGNRVEAEAKVARAAFWATMR